MKKLLYLLALIPITFFLASCDDSSSDGSSSAGWTDREADPDCSPDSLTCWHDIPLVWNAPYNWQLPLQQNEYFNATLPGTLLDSGGGATTSILKTDLDYTAIATDPEATIHFWDGSQAPRFQDPWFKYADIIENLKISYLDAKGRLIETRADVYALIESQDSGHECCTDSDRNIGFNLIRVDRSIDAPPIRDPAIQCEGDDCMYSILGEQNTYTIKATEATFQPTYISVVRTNSSDSAPDEYFARLYTKLDESDYTWLGASANDGQFASVAIQVNGAPLDIDSTYIDNPPVLDTGGGPFQLRGTGDDSFKSSTFIANNPNVTVTHVDDGCGGQGSCQSVSITTDNSIEVSLTDAAGATYSFAMGPYKDDPDSINNVITIDNAGGAVTNTGVPAYVENEIVIDSSTQRIGFKSYPARTP